jgi:hypothetical protein
MKPDGARSQPTPSLLPFLQGPPGTQLDFLLEFAHQHGDEAKRTAGPPAGEADISPRWRTAAPAWSHAFSRYGQRFAQNEGIGYYLAVRSSDFGANDEAKAMLLSRCSVIS